jgi:hypothetical protein
MRAPGPFFLVNDRCAAVGFQVSILGSLRTSGLRLYSDLMVVRVIRAGLFRSLCILVAFDDMFRLRTYTRTVFKHVSRLQPVKAQTLKTR